MQIRKLFSLFLALLILLSGSLLPSYAEETSPDNPDKDPAPYGGFFDPSFVHSMEVTLSPDDWNDLLLNPAEKTKYRADLVIDGEPYVSVSFATKGNSSLLFVANNPDSSRYSYKINFGKFGKGRSFHGLDKLNLQNLFSDATYMKEFLSYELFRRMGVAAPLTCFVHLTINGEDRGVYLAVEEMEDSFLSRFYQGKGTLYKPETHGLTADPAMLANDDILKEKIASQTVLGGDLKYTDDEMNHYADIFDNASTKSGAEDKLRVIKALKALSEHRNLDRYLDTDEIISYFAVHNFLCNFDSYTGVMLHNYFLYEHAGKLSMLPWDYNTAFGAFPTHDGLTPEEDVAWIVSQGIDSPIVTVSDQDRPMWAWILSDEAYRSAYHETFTRLISEQFESGAVSKLIDDTQTMLLPYVETDPTAFFTPEQFRTGCAAMQRFIALRAESIRLQLDGKLSTFTDLQNPEDRVDTTDLRIADMGTSKPE